MYYREQALVIQSPGVHEAPINSQEIDPLQYKLYWTGFGWSPDYPNAQS